jgi:hypothetical protein
MIFLNGVPFYDLNYVATLGTKDIRRIEVISANYLLGEMTLPGLVSIYIRDKRVPASYLKSHSCIFQNTVIPVSNTAGTMPAGSTGSFAGRYPDFRRTLCWDPDMTITAGEKMVLRFKTSRLTGSYRLVVNGMTRKGNLVNATTSFEVK